MNVCEGVMAASSHSATAEGGPEGSGPCHSTHGGSGYTSRLPGCDSFPWPHLPVVQVQGEKVGMRTELQSCSRNATVSMSIHSVLPACSTGDGRGPLTCVSGR